MNESYAFRVTVVSCESIPILRVIPKIQRNPLSRETLSSNLRELKVTEHLGERKNPQAKSLLTGLVDKRFMLPIPDSMNG